MSHMDQIEMEAIAPRVQGLRILFVNVFSIEDSDGSWTLIDTGLPASASRIQSWAEEVFERPPKAILLTHGHFDHAGSARDLAEKWRVPVFAHPREFPYLTGRLEYPEPNVGAGGGLMSLLSPLYPRGPIDLGEWLKPLPPDPRTSLTDLPGWDVLHTPGHTPGHVSLYHPQDGTLLAGDAFCTIVSSFFEKTRL